MDAIKDDILFYAKDRFGCSLIKHLSADNISVENAIVANMLELSMVSRGFKTMQ